MPAYTFDQFDRNLNESLKFLDVDGTYTAVRMVSYGYDGADFYPVSVDSSGVTNVNVVSGSTSGTQYNNGDIDATPTGTLAMGWNLADNKVYAATVVPLTHSQAMATMIVDANGDQITSFGGGTQYTDADVDATPTGTALVWWDAANTLRVVSATKPLPINVTNASVAVTGTFWQATQPVSGTFWQATQPVSATDLDIRNLAKSQDEVYAVLRTDAGAAYDGRSIRALTNSDVVTVEQGTAASLNMTEASASAIKTAVQLIDDPIATIGATPLMRVAIFDSANTQITSFGGGQYADGAGRGTATGTLAMGDDGTNIQSIHVDASGDLQVDVLSMPSVTVTATNLDIRDLTSASDSVEVKQATGTNLHAVIDSGSITANAGTNLNTSLLALETGGNLAAAATSLGLLDNSVDGNYLNVNINLAGTDVLQAVNGINTTGGGVISTAMIAQLDDVSPTAITENQFGNVRMSSRRALLVEGVASGTAVNAILASNSGVDIGDVDVLTCGTITPGTGATNLGKAEDAGHTSGDVGVMALGVANTADANISGTTLDYTPFATDLTGAIHVMGKVASDATAPVNPLLVGAYASLASPTDVSGDGDLVNIWATREGAVVVSNPVGTGTTGTTDCASASTTYRITTSSTRVSNFVLQAKQENVGTITWGWSSTYASNYMQLRPGQPMSLGSIDISLLYFGSTIAGDDINYSYTA